MATGKTLTTASGGTSLLTWSGLANGESGDAFIPGFKPDKTVHVNGTFGSGGTVVIEGSNDGSNYVTLSDIDGSGLSFTSAGLKVVRENPVYIRPRVTAGDGTTSINVYLHNLA